MKGCHTRNRGATEREIARCCNSEELKTLRHAKASMRFDGGSAAAIISERNKDTPAPPHVYDLVGRRPPRKAAAGRRPT